MRLLAWAPESGPIAQLLRQLAATLSQRYQLALGSITLVMGGTCQRTWQHAVLQRAHADPRISIMFRPVVPGD